MNLPLTGFGCSPFRAGGIRVDLEHPIRLALSAGYRLFDLAELYGNEVAIGRALRNAEAPPRDELHLVGKVWRTNYRAADLRRACEASLRRLGFDAFDLYLLHAPDAWQHVAPLEDASVIGWDELERRAVPRDRNGDLRLDDVPLAETWQAMLDLQRDGLTGRVGVSNFSIEQIEALGGERPAANQIASSPTELKPDVLAWCREKEIVLLGHSPLSAGMDKAVVQAIASRHSRTPAQVILRWLIQLGVHPLPTSSSARHIRENLETGDFELNSEEMRSIARN